MEASDSMPVCVKPDPEGEQLDSHVSPSPRKNAEPMSVERQPDVPPTDAASPDSDTRVLGREEEEEEPIDTESVKGIFGWETVDDTSVPYILRKTKRFVSVRIVERKLLSKYPNTFPDELGKKDPLVSYFITEAEAALLNEINTAHCDYEYGHNPFTIKDLIVDLEEFGEFFKVVKKTFPEEVLATMKGEAPAMLPQQQSYKSPDLSQYCGWIQINNTVSPYIMRVDGGEKVKLVPLSVILYAAGLLTNASVEGILPTLQECAMLNETCKTAGFDFTFGKTTRLISVTEVVQRCQVQLFDLPFNNPLQHAHYLDPKSGQPSSRPAQGHLTHLPQQMDGPHSMPHLRMASHRPPAPAALHRAAPPMNPFMPNFPPRQNLPPSPMTIPAMPSYQGHMTRMMGRPPGPREAPHAPPPYPAGMIDTTPHAMEAPPGGHISPGMAPGGQPYWPLLPTGSGKGLASSKTPPVLSESPVSSGYQPYSLPAPSQLYPPSSMAQPDLSHPIFRGAGLMPLRPPACVPGHGHAEAAMRGHKNVYSTRQAQPQAPNVTLVGHGPNPMTFGINQFDSSLFARTDMPEAGFQPDRRRSGESPHNPTPTRHRKTPPSASQFPPSSGHINSSNNRNHSSSSSRGGNNHNTSGASQVPKLCEKITACLVNSKSISCLKLQSGHRTGNFCLVEAVSKLYFPTVPIVEFVKVLQVVLHVQLHECTEEEEAAFVRYYNLPVSKLKCNKMIRVEDLEKFFPQLNYMFTKCPPGSSPEPSPVKRPSSSSSPHKRSAGSSEEGGTPRQVPKLENVVRKLHQDKGHTQPGHNGVPSTAAGDASAAVIVIDD